MSGSPPFDLPSGKIQFFDNYIPSLEPGKNYQITVEQKIEGIDDGGYFQPIAQVFEVRAPQFALDPTELHSVYPPDKSNGIYGEVLPHVVFNKRVLPWERFLTADDKTIPWMALLTFEEGEINVDPQTNSSIITSTVKQLLQSDESVLKPAIDQSTVSEDVLASTCQSIVIGAEVFQALVPRLDELKYLAHCRQVNTGDQEAPSFEDEGWFSVVVSNRFPKSDASGDGASGSKNIVHLVSLEGYSHYLADNSTFPQKQDGSGPKNIQLVSLVNWSFVSSPDAGEGFARLVENFVTEAGNDPQSLMLKLPVAQSGKSTASTAESEALQRLNDGYVAVSYITNYGEKTFAWYRGPLTPVTPQPLPETVAIYTNVSQAIIYVQSQGVFDQSYAAAWEIGRALALAGRNFAVTLLNFRRRTHKMVNKLLNRLQSGHFDASEDLSKLLGNNLIKQKFEQMIEQDLGRQLTKAFAKLNAESGAAASSQTEMDNDSDDTSDPKQALQGFLAQPDVRAVIQREVKDAIEPIAEWLARLKLLYNVPFNHLVPDQRMLPVESIRFFYIDPYWLDTAVDGALSVGVESSRDINLYQIIEDVLNDAIDEEFQLVRGKIHSQAKTKPPAGTSAINSGVLIRSAIVSGWPGFEVKALANGHPVQLLRMESLSSDVMLCLFSGIPDTVQISEPSQGLRFGVEDEDVIELRSLTVPVGHPLGKIFPDGTGGFSQFTRSVTAGVGARVLSINSGSVSLVPALCKALGVASIGPADFAIQMVKAPERLSFNPPR